MIIQISISILIRRFHLDHERFIQMALELAQRAIEVIDPVLETQAAQLHQDFWLSQND